MLLPAVSYFIALTEGEGVTQGQRPAAYGVFFMGPEKGWRPSQIESWRPSDL